VDCFPTKKPWLNGWCAAHGVRRLGHSKKFTLEGGGASSPDEESPFTRPDTAAPLIAQFIQLVRASRSLSTAGRTVWLEWFRGLEIERDPNV